MPLANALMQIIIKAQEQQAAGRDKQALQSYQKAVAAAKKGTEEEFVTTNLLGHMREWLEMMELSDYDPNAIPDCFEDQIVAEGKKKAKGKVASSKETAVKSKAKSESDVKSKSTIKSVTMQPEPDAATTKKKSGKLEWPGSR